MGSPSPLEAFFIAEDVHDSQPTSTAGVVPLGDRGDCSPESPETSLGEETWPGSVAPLRVATARIRVLSASMASPRSSEWPSGQRGDRPPRYHRRAGS